MNDPNVYQFAGIEGLIFRNGRDFLVRKKWRPGQIYIEIEQKRIGMNTLRKIARKTETENICPF